MANRIFIEYNNQRMQLPINPEHLKIKRDSDNSTIDIVRLGEINRLGHRKLRQCSIDSFFPGRGNLSFAKGNFHSPHTYIQFFESIRSARRPCRLTVTGTRINMLASIEAFDIEYKGAEGDVYFKLDFKEYREHAARQVELNIRPPQPRPPSPNQQITVGAIVIVNGRLHRDSFGAGPGQTEQNATRRVSHVVQGRQFPYHVKTLDGGWRGWVTASSVRLR